MSTNLPFSSEGGHGLRLACQDGRESVISSGGVRLFFPRISHICGTASERRPGLIVCTSAVMNIYGGVNGVAEITTGGCSGCFQLHSGV